MRRRKLLGLAAALLVGSVALLLWPRAPRFPREKFDRITHGMSRADIEALLGPPGDFTTGPYLIGFARDDYDEEDPPEAVRWSGWKDDQGYIHIGYDASDKVVSKSFQRIKRTAREPREWLDLVQRQWREWFP